jgi:hypothetical protein
LSRRKKTCFLITYTGFAANQEEAGGNYAVMGLVIGLTSPICGMAIELKSIE